MNKLFSFLISCLHNVAIFKTRTRLQSASSFFQCMTVAGLLCACTIKGELYILPPPEITIETQPTPITIVTEGSVTGSLSVVATATREGTLSYQWYSAGVNSSAGGAEIAGATDASFDIPATLKAAATPYYYFCEVRAKGVENSASDAVPLRSNVAAVNVLPLPKITISAQPAETTNVTEGDIADILTVSASVSENATLSYQWYSATTNSNAGGVVIEGATAASFEIPKTLTVAGSPYYYFCELSATGGAVAVRSDVATVNVQPAGTSIINIETQPAKITYVTEGGITGSLTVGASVTEGAILNYQWFSNTADSNVGGTLIAGETSAIFEIPKDIKVAGSPYYYFCEVSATDAESKRSDAATVTVTAQGVLPALSTNNIEIYTATTATICGNITNAGTPPYTERGVVYATTENPTTDDGKKIVSGEGITGNFCAEIEGLEPNTKYFARAYATNTAGTKYGIQREFTTTGNKPTLTTNAATNITAAAAILGGNIVSVGSPAYTERGVVYAKTAIADTQEPRNTENQKIVSGTGIGSFEITVDGLSIFTEYHVRAYAINTEGHAYGAPIDFKTLDIPPVFVMNPITNITESGATVNVSVTGGGTPAYTDCGVVYATTANPTIANSKKTLSTTGAANTFTGEITGLTPGTTYYVRPYATNAADTRYGAQATFTAKKVTVGGQTGTLTAGVAGSVTFSVTTVGIANGSYSATVANLPTGVSVQGQVAISNNAGTLTLSGATGTMASTNSNLTLTIDGAKSAAFTLTIKCVTVGAQNGSLWAGYAGSVTFSVTTCSIANGSYPATLANLPAGVSVQGQVTIANNTGTLTLAGNATTVAASIGTLHLTIDGAQSAAFTLTVSAAVHPTFTTNAPSNVTATSATLGGNITNAGTPAYTERGVVYATTQNPTTANSKKIISGSGTGIFSDVVTGLTAYTKYYVRAYVITPLGTFYGDEVTVTPFSIEMISVEKGTFTMGSENSLDWNASPSHSVTLTQNYNIGKYQVTQGQWKAVMDGANPSSFLNGDNYPVEMVSWNDIVGTDASEEGYNINGISYYKNGFCYKLSQLAGGGKQYRLPTEAEWEFAARGGNTGKDNNHIFSGSDEIKDVAWYIGNNDPFGTKPVGGKEPNELGIYDMSGNVWEWCGDWYASYDSNAQTDPTGPTSGISRVLRGGYWINIADNCRIAGRGDGTLDDRGNAVGFRLACSSN